jgi:hypothetical protein
MPLQGVVDGNAVEHRAARAVDAQREIGSRRQRLQLVEEGLGRNAEGADLVVDRDLGTMSLRPELEPALHAAFS